MNVDVLANTSAIVIKPLRPHPKPVKFHGELEQIYTAYFAIRAILILYQENQINLFSHQVSLWEAFKVP